MLVNLRRSLVFALIAIVGTLAYAFIGTGVSQLLFKGAANGSLTANGSTLIGQNWAATKCPGHPLGSCVFHGRPDDTGPYAANAKNDVAGGDNPLVANGSDGESAATNLGPRSATLLANTKALVAYWHELGVANPTPDLVTTSGSGYDPDISATDALVQVPMVAKATGLSADVLRRLIAEQNHAAQLGFLGGSYVDVLQLNEALAKLK
jgi:potassium-transporting ATPase KdpC subunit